MRRVAVLLGSFLLGSIGCGATEAGPTVAAPDDAGDADASSWYAPNDAGDAEDGDEACMAKATAGDLDGCANCCFGRRPVAEAVLWNALRACLCRKPDPTCAVECGDRFCAGTLSSDEVGKSMKPCVKCLEQAVEATDVDCGTFMLEACNLDDECTRADLCSEQCEVVGASPVDAGSD